jgi:hypothetical protein
MTESDYIPNRTIANESEGAVHTTTTGTGHSQVVVINLDKIKQLLEVVAVVGAVILAAIALSWASNSEREGRLAQMSTTMLERDRIAPLEAKVQELESRGPQTIIVKEEYDNGLRGMRDHRPGSANGRDRAKN